MHIRARLQHRRLQISLVDTRRIGGKVRQEHVAALGSVPPNMSVADRAVFWDQVEQRLARLGNRLGKEAHAKVLAELRTKVPVPTEAEREADNGKDEFAEGVAILVRAGWSPAQIVRAIRMAELNEDEMQEVVTETVRMFERAQRAAFNKVYRRRRATA